MPRGTHLIPSGMRDRTTPYHEGVIRPRLVAVVGLLGALATAAACGTALSAAGRGSTAALSAHPWPTGSALTAPSAPASSPGSSPGWAPGSSDAPPPSTPMVAVPREEAPATQADPTHGAPGAPAPAPAAPAVPAVANVVPAWIPYPDARKQQMADYALARYGTWTWQLHPQVIVLHFTATSDDPWSVINYFGSNDLSDGAPGVCAHFVLGQDGTAYQLVPTDVMCRHTIGLNHVAIGIEVAQSTYGNSSAWAEDQIFNRPAQIGALVRLVKDLQAQYGIPTDRVIGHGTANDDPQFLDLTGRRNDHTDWGWPSVDRFRGLLAATP